MSTKSLFTLFLSIATSAPAASLRSCRELSDAVSERQVGIDFDITGQVSSISRFTNTFTLQDASGPAAVSSLDQNLIDHWPSPKRWDIIHVIGRTINDDGDIKARGFALTVLRHELAMKPLTITARQLVQNPQDGLYVLLRGTVDDAFCDEIDPRCRILVLNTGDERLSVTYDPPDPPIESFLGATVELKCIFFRASYSSRKHFGLHVSVSERDDLTIIGRQDNFPFGAPPLTDCVGLRPQDISTLDRRRTDGRVLAVWDRNKMLLREPNDRIVLVQISAQALPACGTDVEAVGFPETDLYRVNLTRSVWRSVSMPRHEPEDAPLRPSFTDLFTDKEGRPCVSTEFFAKTIQLCGIIRDIRHDASGRGTFSLRDKDCSILVDASETPEALLDRQDGERVEVTGVFVLCADVWRPNLVFPHINDVRLVLRTPQDLVILANPPWWTPARLLFVIGFLAVILMAIAFWNLSLRRLAERRGRQLAHEAVGRAESELKVCERTRLAVELHDALSQTLTGVAMEIRAADKTISTDTERSRGHLVRAERTVDACRGELKNCLWDLRNDAIDEADMNEAIRRTLAPHLGDAALTVRFAVPRNRFSDNTAHAVLRILRELTVNAIRHGHAKTLRIAGAIEGDTFLFSVRDDGNGFDPDTAPGIVEGHFGLQGIRERIERFGGDLEIISRPGAGTKVTVSLSVPKEQTS